VADVAGMKKQDLIFKILKERVKMNGLMYGEGTLEILPDGFGFLRSPDYHYLSCPDDIYVSPSQIRRFGLQTGAPCPGRSGRPRRTNATSPAARRGDQLPGSEPAGRKVSFDDLTPLHPDKRDHDGAPTPPEELAMRVVDMIAPIGFGQRG
jgi:transcription termination factor Rho